ncbi:MAG: HK97 gp10 family phage protein [Bacilli bacterium]
MIEFKIEIPNINKLSDNLRKFPEVSYRHIQEAVSKSIMLTVRNIKLTTPVKTGNLRRNIRGTINPLRGLIASYNAPYAKYVHKRNPFMFRGLQNSEAKINENFDKALRNIIKETTK